MNKGCPQKWQLWRYKGGPEKCVKSPTANRKLQVELSGKWEGRRNGHWITMEMLSAPSDKGNFNRAVVFWGLAGPRKACELRCRRTCQTVLSWHSGWSFSLQRLPRSVYEGSSIKTTELPNQNRRKDSSSSVVLFTKIRGVINSFFSLHGCRTTILPGRRRDNPFLVHHKVLNSRMVQAGAVHNKDSAASQSF